jgi:hypothetical protein
MFQAVLVTPASTRINNCKSLREQEKCVQIALTFLQKTNLLPKTRVAERRKGRANLVAPWSLVVSPIIVKEPTLRHRSRHHFHHRHFHSHQKQPAAARVHSKRDL